MNKFRIGNNITVNWDVKKNGQDFSLEGKAVFLYMTHARGRELYSGKVTISGNRLSFVFDGLEQKVLGRYTLTIDVRNGDLTRALIQDKCGAFILVGRSCAEQPEETNYVVNL